MPKQEPLSPARIQKLVYYCQVWSLVWTERPLFEEKILAGASGPLIKELRKRSIGLSTALCSWPQGDSSKLNKDQRGTVDAVIKSYKAKSTLALSMAIREEGPWQEAKGKGKKGRTPNEITQESMYLYYDGLRFNPELY
jgi:uncharacterized phage-associated protein